MKHLKNLCLMALVCFAVSAFAQAAKPAATPNAQAKKTAPPTIASAVDQQISILEREFVGAAEAMPDDKFNFTPVTLNIPGSEYKTVKTFAEEVRHVAATNYLLWGAITGDKSPIESKEDNGPSELKTKAEIVKYLKDSFAIGHKAAQSLLRKVLLLRFPAHLARDRQPSCSALLSPWPTLLITTARWWNTCA